MGRSKVMGVAAEKEVASAIGTLRMVGVSMGNSASLSTGRNEEMGVAAEKEGDLSTAPVQAVAKPPAAPAPSYSRRQPRGRH